MSDRPTVTNESVRLAVFGRLMENPAQNPDEAGRIAALVAEELVPVAETPTDTLLREQDERIKSYGWPSTESGLRERLLIHAESIHLRGWFATDGAYDAWIDGLLSLMDGDT